MAVRSKADQIQKIYDSYRLDKKEIYEKTQFILETYRSAVWETKYKADEIRQVSLETFGSDLDASLFYLMEFAPVNERERFEEKLRKMFNTKWIVETIDSALEAIRDYPGSGEDYYRIIYYTYISKQIYTGEYLYEKTELPRTTYFRKKKEAIQLFGAYLWGYSVPHIFSDITSAATPEENGKDISPV